MMKDTASNAINIVFSSLESIIYSAESASAVDAEI